MAHQQESFHPFSSRQSLSCFLSHMAKWSTPKPRGPDSCQSHRIPTLPKSCGYPWVWLLHLGLNPSTWLLLQPHFQVLLHSVNTCQRSRILSALLGCHSKSGQVWPHCMETIFSKLSHRCCNQGELPRLGWKSLPSPWLKARPQLFNISMKPVKGYRYVK